MKKKYPAFVYLPFLLAMCISGTMYSQLAFHRGTLVISASEGSTFSNVISRNIDGKQPVNVYNMHMHGVRDPLILEYGISNRWGISATLGTDLFNVNSMAFYGFRASNSKVMLTTSEVTLDANYHFYVTKNTDISAFGALGLSSVTINEKDGDNLYRYNAGGGIARIGIRGRYYFWKRLGAFGMASLYSAGCSPKGVKGNTVGNGYGTSIRGHAVEFGLCFRILK